MKSWLAMLTLLPTLVLAAPQAQTVAPAAKVVRVEMETSYGKLVVELDSAKAPKTVANFLKYVKDGSYQGTQFHRVIPGFVVQGGGYDSHFTSLPNYPAVENESKNGLSNSRGTLAMARTGDPHSATRQFYFNLKNNEALDGGVNWGYTVFGKVVSGIEVLDKIAAQPTGFNPDLQADDVPQQPILLKQVTLLP